MNELDPQSIVPLYKQLKDLLLQEIKEGIYKANQKIPTELELSEKYQISRMTVRKALAELVEEGVLAKKQGKGTIVNVSSVAASKGHINRLAYSASKGGLNLFTQALAKELAPSNIQVNAIACGVIDTRMNACFDAEERSELENEIPAGRFAAPSEVADFVQQLIDAPSYLTGQIISFDGGYL